MSVLKTSVVTFNCGKASVDPHALARHLISSATLPDLLVVSLQEIAPLAQAFIGGSFVHPFLRRIWQAVKLAARDRAEYQYVLTRNIGTTAIMLFALPETHTRIQNLEVASTPVGKYDLGNKGAVAIRLEFTVDDDVRRVLAFVAAHLTPMEADFERRNHDWEVITKTLIFEPADGEQAAPPTTYDETDPLIARSNGRRAAPQETSIYEPGTLLFIAGDLNYRISDTKPTSNEYTTFPQPTDSLDAWRKGDQLDRERVAGRTLQYLTESPIHFPPTYKYAMDVPGFQWPQDGSEPDTWPWAQHRFPSWCDRILYSDYATAGLVKVIRYTALPLLSSSDHRPVVLDMEIDMAASSWTVASRVKTPFQIDPAWKTRKAAGRRLELAVGAFAYLGMTWEGNGILLAGVIGAIGGYAVLSSLIAAQ